MWKSRAICIALLLTTLALAGACGESEPAEVLEPETKQEEEVKEDPIPPYLDRFAARTGAMLRGRKANPAILASVQKQARKKVAERRDPYHYRSILRRVYTPDDGATPELYFVSGARLSPLGREVLDHLKAMDTHGLKIDKHYHVKQIEELLAELPNDNPPELDLGEADRAVVAQLIKDKGLDVSKASTDKVLLDLLMSDTSPLPNFASRVPEDEELSKKQIKNVAKVEMYLTDAVSRYAWDMRYRNRRWFDEARFEGKRKHEWDGILSDILREDVPTALRDNGDLVGWMKELIPNNRQYHKLIPVLAKYRKFEEAGGWDEVNKVTGLRKGMRHDVVPDLKKRLRAEGYFPEDGSLDKKFDDQLEAAIREYQETHQMKVTGEPHKSFWGSINVSLSKRIKQIEVTMDRWRYQTNIIEGGEDEYFVFVNIPDFHAEIWRKGKREMRFKVIVGNRKFGCNANTGRWVRINTTPRQSNMIRHIVINPWWNVPNRIMKEEIMPKIEENPNYLEENNYECLRRQDGKCVKVRQSAGEDNALGRIKFMFPNQYNTYMHDTNKKHFFKYHVRGMSHGCIRVETPIEYAQYLLKQDGQWDEAKFQEMYDSKTEHTVKLNKPVPVHIEYYTIRVDDKGRANFLADIYKFDHYTMRGRDWDPRRCTPEEKEHARPPFTDDGTE